MIKCSPLGEVPLCDFKDTFQWLIFCTRPWPNRVNATRPHRSMIVDPGHRLAPSQRAIVWIFTKSWWRHQNGNITALLALCAGIHRSPVNSAHKSQWRGALMFSLNWVWKNSWINNRAAGDLRGDRAHYDVIVIIPWRHVVSPGPSHYLNQIRRVDD